MIPTSNIQTSMAPKKTLRHESGSPLHHHSKTSNKPTAHTVRVQAGCRANILILNANKSQLLTSKCSTRQSH